MRTTPAKLRRTALALAVGASLALTGCSGGPTDTTNGATNGATNQAADAGAQQAPPVPSLLVANEQTWTPEALEDLLAPVALYPDEVLGHVLVAATNPQEVLDAGSWRLQNETLEGKALDDAAQAAGFTAPVRVLVQNPTVLDMMCSEFGWTQELGQAYVNDQEGVLAAVQRLRRQARDAGTLESSDKMLVDVEAEAGEQAITLRSPEPGVVYVPQYDPERVYFTSEADHDDDGVGTGTVVALSLLAFGAGLALGSIFDDDDDDWYDDDYYYPSYYGPPMPYYAHYGYRPVYAGYRPAYAYVRPAGYRYGYGTYGNTTIVNRTANNYWTRYDDRAYVRAGDRAVVSPITKARGARPELQYLDAKAKRGPARRAPEVTAERGQYQTKRRETAARAETRRAAEADRRRAGGGGRVDRAGGGAGDRTGDRKVDRSGDRAGGRGGGGGAGRTDTRDGGGRAPAKTGGGRDADRGGKGGGNKRATTGGAGGGGGGNDRARAKTVTGGGGGDRPKARSGGGGGERPKARSGGGGDRPKAGGSPGGGRPSGGRGGGGRRGD